MMNKHKLIKIFASNLANAVIHQILERAIDKIEIAESYKKEVKNSWEIAKKYREKINPVNGNLPDEDSEVIKREIVNKIKAELKLRIKRGYENIDISLVEESVEKALKEIGIK